MSLVLLAFLALDPLTPEEVLRSVNQHFPLLTAVLQERGIAEGGNISAKGEFDTKIKAKGDVEQFGFYRNETFDALVEQPLQAWGTDVYGGYKLGRGRFSPAEDKSVTLSAGEYRAGIRTNLLRDRAIDARRAGLQTTGIQKDVAETTVDKSRLTFFKEALKDYWEWVAAGQQLKVAKALLDLAEARNTQIEESVKLGSLAPLELTDNRQTILRRRGAVVGAERNLQNRAIELSLFLRAPDGTPVMPTADRLPPIPEPPGDLEAARVEQDLTFAIQQRPEVRGLLLKRQQQQVEVRLAGNQIAPQLDFFFQYSRDAGTGSRTKVGDNVESGIIFELPAQRRKAIGKNVQQNAKLQQIESELRFSRDRVVADVQDAVSAVRAAYESLGVVRNEVLTAKQLEEAERARFDLGDSTQFLVNLRELATADAQFREIKAQSDYFKAFAEYDGATTRIFSRYALTKP
jgi:outer membrane protein, heavy metal efflux system